MHAICQQEERLETLNRTQPERPWSSLTESRRCIACDHIFNATQVVIRRRREGVRLSCPRCGGAPALWVRLGNPLIDDQVWAEWETAIQSTAEEAQELEAIPAH